MKTQKSPQGYCELCGIPIQGKGVTVIYEGSVITVCNSCYAKIRKYAKLYDEKSVKHTKSSQTIKNTAQKIVQKDSQAELEIVDDYYKIIKSAREKMGLTTKQLAEKLKVSENIIKRFEQGKLKPTIDQARALERILSIKLIIQISNMEENKSKTKNYELTLGDVVNFRDEKK